MQTVKGSAILFASTAILALVAAPAHAQTDPTVDQPVDPAETSVKGGLQEIVVTARKREESLQDIPVAVTAFNAEMIESRDLTSSESVAAQTPNLQVGEATTGSGAQITLRGIGTPASALGIESSTAVIVDGVYYGNGRILKEGFFDLARIEVLKGPQALFFGKNATAGVISITTGDPTDTFEASSRVGYEFNGGKLFGEQIVSGPLGDTVSGRLALRASKMFGSYTQMLGDDIPLSFVDLDGGPGFDTVAPAKRGDVPGEKEFIGRASLKFEPNDRFTNILKASMSYNRTRDAAWNNIVYSCATGFSTLQPDVPCRKSWYAYRSDAPVEVAEVFPFAYEGGKLGSTYKSFQITNNANTILAMSC